MAQWQPGKEAAKEIGKADIAGNGAWRDLVVSWTGKRLVVEQDGKALLVAALPDPLPISANARGLDIVYSGVSDRKTTVPAIVFGPLPGVVIDDLHMWRKGINKE